MICGWHIIRENRRLRFDSNRVVVEPGFVYSYEFKRPPLLCARGMHASTKLWDAIRCAYQIDILPSKKVWICRINLHGDMQLGRDKMVGRHREVEWMITSMAFVAEYKKRRPGSFYRNGMLPMFFGSNLTTDEICAEIEDVANTARDTMMKADGKAGEWAKGC